MLYEGEVYVKDSSIEIQLTPQSKGSEYNLQFDDNGDTLEKTMAQLHPFFNPDDDAETPKSYTQKLKNKGYGTFYTSSQNINDLVNLYANTQPKDMNPFPGLSRPRQSNEIIFTETICKFNGIINENVVKDKTIQFKYRGVLQ